MTISGQTIPAGDHVYLVFAAGNRDAAAFPAPAELRLDRTNGVRYLSFGRGIHLCLGAPVARMEARVGLECLIDGVGSVEPLPDPPRRYLRSYLLHGLTELLVRVSPPNAMGAAAGRGRIAQLLSQLCRTLAAHLRSPWGMMPPRWS